MSGTVQFVVVETDIAYSWGGGTTLYDVARDMLPDQNGESVSIPVGSIDKIRSFTLGSGWNADKCAIVVFVQGSSKEIYQGAKRAVVVATTDPDIAVSPDTLRFTWESGKKSYSLLTPMENTILSNDISSYYYRRSAHLNDCEVMKVSNKGGKGVDTLFPVFEGPFYGGWPSDYRVEYEATQLTPSVACSVIAIAHGVAAPTAGASKQCSVFVWSDASGTPGTKLYKAKVTASVASASTIEINWYTVTPAVYVTGPFWVGNYEMDTLFPTSGLDSIISSPNKYSTNGSSWTDDEAEYFHGAIVQYAGEIKDTVKTLTVYNAGGTTLAVSNIVGNQSWIVNITPTSFNVSPSGSQAVTVTVTKNGLSTGIYSGNLTISSNDPDEGSYVEPVKFSVNIVGTEESEDSYSHSLFCKPNPFTRYVNIRYAIDSRNKITLGVYDLSGRMVKSLVMQKEQDAGSYNVDVDTKDLLNGIYFAKLETGNHKVVQKLILMR